MSSIVCKDLCKTFQQGDEIITGLDNVSLTIDEGDFVCLSGPSGSAIITDPVIDDDIRLFDFTRVISEDNNSALSHRLDRLYAEYAGANAVGRFGRQAISWGNGLVYTPMDFINPFDPSAIDKE